MQTKSVTGFHLHPLHLNQRGRLKSAFSAPTFSNVLMSSPFPEAMFITYRAGRSCRTKGPSAG